MPVDLSSTLPPTWAPTGPVVTNLAYDPAATQLPGIDGKLMVTQRWYGGGTNAGTTTLEATDGPADGPETFKRKTWTVVTPGNVQDVAYSFSTGAGTLAFPVVAGQEWTFSYFYRTSWAADGTNNEIVVTLYDAAGVSLGNFPGPKQPFPVANEWTRIGRSFTVPAGAAFMQVWHNFYSTVSAPAVGDTLDGTGLLAQNGLVLNPYFDGNTQDDTGPGYLYDWTGPENASTSIATALVATPADPADYLFNPNNPRPRGILTSNRLSTFLFELLNQDDESQGVMDDIMDSSATLTWDVDGKIKGGGSIEVADMGHGFDWLKSRLRVTRFVNGVAWGRGIWVPTLPTAKWASDHRYWTIELHDKLVVLDQDAIAEGYALPEGTNVIDIVRLIIESTGESAGSITASEKVTNSEMFWEAGTTKLTIINNLLDANGYYTLRTGDNGEYITEPYVPPNQRAIRYDFVDGENSIYIDTFEVAQDIFFIPNRVVAIQQGDDETEGMVGVAENVDPDSPYSFPNVGRWIVDVQTGVEAFDQEAIDTYAYSRLVDLSNPSATISIQVAPVPLNIYDAVTFRSEPAGIEGRFVVDRMSEDLTPTGLMKVTLRKIVELVVEQ